MVLQRSFVSIGLIMALASCGGDDSSHSANDTTTYVPPAPVTHADPTLTGDISYSNVSVHDPSIIKDSDGTYYVFGSHMGYAKSTDLMHWEQLNPSASSNEEAVINTPLFNTYQTEVADGIAWVRNNVGSWAPDVIKLDDGKYYFYFDHCAGDGADLTACYHRSYLGVAVSDKITGPYVNQGIFIKSGQESGEAAQLPDGVTAAYDYNTNPNAIDPAVFRDKDGGLWMTYGSYSGGIFVLKLDPATGKPLPGQGWGTHVVGGDTAPIEGSYVLYSPETEYYYLFTSFAGFAQNDGYNIRISRSKSPQGPYVDAADHDMIAASGTVDKIADYGVKLMGGFLFDANTGDAGSDHGYMSPGHNSAYYDKDSGKYFLVFHTRFPGTGEGHEVRVHEMFMNADGWLVASPHRYAPISGDNVVDESDVEGSYQFINHEHDNNKTVHTSTYITLTRSWTNKGKISGAYTGSYTMDDEHHITLNFDDLGTFDGVLAWQYNDNIGKLVPTFTAVSTAGASIWGSQLPVSNVTTALNNIASAISLPDATTTALNLPTTGTQGAVISWSSSDPSVISSTGVVNRPAGGSANATVTLTATITLNGKTLTKTYTIEVEARKAYNRVAQYSFENGLGDTLGNKASGVVIGNKIGVDGGTLAFEVGETGNALVLDGNSGIRLPDSLINSNEYTVSLWVKANVLSMHTPVFFGAATDASWVSLLPMGWDSNILLWSNNNGSWFDGKTNLAATVGQWTHLAFSVNHGVAKVYVNGEEKASGGNFPDLFSRTSGVFTLGVNYWDTAFSGQIDELKIYDAALAAEEVKALDIDNLPSSQLLQSATNLLDLGDVSAVVDDMTLPLNGAYASAVSWISSNPAIVSNDGRVTRPTESQGDQTVTLTATITLDGATSTKTFDVTVRSMAAPTPMVEYNFDNGDLADGQGSFAAGTVIGSKVGTSGGALLFETGVVGKALVLNGSTGVQLPNNLIDDNSYSISLWLNPSALTQYTTAFFGYASGTSWISVVPYGNAAVSGNTMVWSGESWFDAGTKEQIPLNTWSHLAMVVSGSKITVYLNGEAQFTGTGFPNVFGNGATTGFALGVNYWDTPFKGMIDEVKIYDNAISAEDVQLLFREGSN